jgi:hypothetical protein
MSKKCPERGFCGGLLATGYLTVANRCGGFFGRKAAGNLERNNSKSSRNLERRER